MRYVVVFDTNILLSALLSLNGNPFRCLAMAKIGRQNLSFCYRNLNYVALTNVVR